MPEKSQPKKMLRITLVKKRDWLFREKHKATLRALGLHRLNQTVVQVDTPALRGMLCKVNHLVQIEEAGGEMKLNDLMPNEGSRKPRKRSGHGISAGQGKTAGRGTKGQGSRRAKAVICTDRVVTCLSTAACRSCVVKALRRPIRYSYNEVNLEQLARSSRRHRSNSRTPGRAKACCTSLPSLWYFLGVVKLQCAAEGTCSA